MFNEKYIFKGVPWSIAIVDGRNPAPPDMYKNLVNNGKKNTYQPQLVSGSRISNEPSTVLQNCRLSPIIPGTRKEVYLAVFGRYSLPETNSSPRKNGAWFGYIREEILASYIGIIMSYTP